MKQAGRLAGRLSEKLATAAKPDLFLGFGKVEPALAPRSDLILATSKDHGCGVFVCCKISQRQHVPRSKTTHRRRCVSWPVNVSGLGKRPALGGYCGRCNVGDSAPARPPKLCRGREIATRSCPKRVGVGCNCPMSRPASLSPVRIRSPSINAPPSRMVCEGRHREPETPDLLRQWPSGTLRLLSWSGHQGRVGVIGALQAAHQAAGSRCAHGWTLTLSDGGGSPKCADGSRMGEKIAKPQE